MANLLQSGVASAERVFEVLDEEEQVPEEASSLNPTCGRVAFEHIWFSYDKAKPLITDLSWSPSRAARWPSLARRGRQDHMVNLIEVL